MGIRCPDVRLTAFLPGRLTIRPVLIIHLPRVFFLHPAHLPQQSILVLRFPAAQDFFLDPPGRVIGITRFLLARCRQQCRDCYSSPPWFLKTNAALLRLHRIANFNGVSPSLSLALTIAPRSNSISKTSSSPVTAAKCNGVSIISSPQAFTSAPLSNRNSTCVFSPINEAICNGVRREWHLLKHILGYPVELIIAA